MAILPAVGVLEYNGVAFDSLHRSEVKGEVVLDESKRVVKWIAWTIDVDAWIGGSIDTGPQLEQKRIKLTEIGEELFYYDKGFGELIVNAPHVSEALDVNWGPVPKMLSWKPLGGANGCLIHWQITTCIPECANPRYEGLLAFNYTVNWDVDKDSYQSRTITGHVEIGQTRYSGQPRRVFESADQWRERIRPAVPLGFQRTTPGRFTLSMNRNRLDFLFVDTQIPRPYPGFATGVDAKQRVTRGRVRKTGAPSFMSWDVELSATITLPPDRPRSEAWNVFLIILQSRLRGIRGAVNGEDLRTRIGLTKAGEAYLHSLQIEEDIFGRTSSFSVKYEFINVTLSEILEASNLWTAIGDVRGNAAWAAYKAANDKGTWGVRGAAGLKHLDGEEILVDLCLPSSGTTLTGKLPPSTPSELRTIPLPKPGKPGDPDPSFTWRYYINTLTVVEENRIARHKRLPIEPPAAAKPNFGFIVSAPDPLGKNAQVFAKLDNAPDLPAKKTRQPDVVQQLGSSSYLIIMEGEAERIQFEVPIPRLAKVGGIEVTQVSAYVRRGVVGILGGLPINAAVWRIAYILPEKFEGMMPSLANPAYMLPGG